MLQFEELRQRLEGLYPQIQDLAGAIGLPQMKREAEELDMKAAADGFWDDMETAQKVTQRAALLKDGIERYEKLVRDYHDTLTLIGLADEEGDLSVLEECAAGVGKVEEALDEQRLATLLTGEYDARNAILTFHAGAGGTEAQDWAEMLYRMYTHWTERHGFSYKILDYLDGDEAGLKSASIQITGQNAYGFLKGSTGWFGSPPSTPPGGGTPPLRRWRSFPSWTTASRSRFGPRILKWMCSVPAVPAASTSTKPLPPSG